jgi:WD40 repeat protein
MLMEVQLEQIYTGHADAVYCLQRSMADQVFYSGSGDGFVGCWNILTGTFEKPLIKTSGSIYALALDVSGFTLYVGQRGGILYKVDISRKHAPKAVEAHQGDVFAICIDDSRQKLLTGGGDGFLKVWSLTDMQLIASFKLSSSNIRCLSISPDDRLLSVGLSDHTIRIFDLDTFTQEAVLRGHTSSVFTSVWKDEYTLISGGRDAMIRKWVLNDGWQEEVSLPAHMFTINHLLLSPNGKYLASAGRDKEVKIWDANTLRLLKVIDRLKYPDAHTHSVNRLLWMDDHTLLSTGDDKRILSWKWNEVE